MASAGLEPEPFLSQNCLYTSTPDHDYILDRVPGFDAVVLAGGGSGHAFKMGPAIGELCACLALGREPSLQVGRRAAGRSSGQSGGDAHGAARSGAPSRGEPHGRAGGRSGAVG